MNKSEQGQNDVDKKQTKKTVCIFNTLCAGEFIFALRHLKMSVHLATKFWPFQLKTEENCSVIEANHVSCLVMLFTQETQVSFK